MAMQNPMLASNPQVMRALTERQLHARDMVDIIAMLEPVPPPPPPPVPQEEENAKFLEGANPAVNPADNHDEHLIKIAQFKGSPEFQALTPEMTNALDQHARGHVAGKIRKDMQDAGQQQGQNGGVPGAPGGGHAAMAGAPGQPPPPQAPPAPRPGAI